MGEGNLLDGNGPAEQSAFPSRITPQAADRCGRCWGAGKNMLPSTSNALPNLQCTFVEVTCSVCGGTGKRQPDPAADEIAALRARVAELEAENADLRSSVVAFAAPWAVNYARDWGLPPGHLDPRHYDILAKAGARMDDFTRGGPADGR